MDYGAKDTTFQKVGLTFILNARFMVCNDMLIKKVISIIREQKWGLNTYLYAPKDDYKHRMYWRDLYSAEEAGEHTLARP